MRRYGTERRGTRRELVQITGHSHEWHGRRLCSGYNWGVCRFNLSGDGYRVPNAHIRLSGVYDEFPKPVVSAAASCPTGKRVSQTQLMAMLSRFHEHQNALRIHRPVHDANAGSFAAASRAGEGDAVMSRAGMEMEASRMRRTICRPVIDGMCRSTMTQVALLDPFSMKSSGDTYVATSYSYALSRNLKKSRTTESLSTTATTPRRDMPGKLAGRRTGKPPEVGPLVRP
jgi:hypothetical protein